MKSSLIPSLLAWLHLLTLSTLAGSFTDNFSTDTSSQYQATNTFGSGGNYTISGGSLHLTPSSNNTYNVFHQNALLEVGELVRVTVPINTIKDFYLTASTVARGPNTDSEDGIRLNLNSTGFRSRIYRDGALTNNTYAGTPIGWTGEMTLYIYRDTATVYRVGYDTGAGVQVMDTITITQTANTPGLYVGVEAYHTGTRSFDDLQISTIATTPSISSFTADQLTISQPGPVTLSWITTNAETVTLNGNDVTGQSPLTVTVSQSEDFTLVATGADGTQTSRALSISVGESFSIAAVADPQYADVPTGWRGGGREPELGIERLNHAVSAYNQRDLDWGVILGDLIDFDDIAYGNPPPGEVDGPHDWANTDGILAAWNNLNLPKYTVLGNHEFYVPDKDIDGLSKPYSVFRKFGFHEKPYYTFRHKGFRFIVLMADWRYLDYDPSLPEFSIAKNYYDDMTGASKKWWNGAISLTQRKWFMDHLDDSLSLGEKVVCLVHDPTHRPVDGHSLLNSEEMLDILNGYPNVVMWLNGHNHGGAYAIENGRHHLNLKGMQSDGQNWYQLDFHPSQITVYQAENTIVPVYTLDITRPAPTTDCPAGFTVSATAGQAVITWGNEPSTAEGVIIERRHLSPLQAELPSTAETLSWQEVTTLSTPSARTYADTPPHPIAEYKYRIRYNDSSAGSSYSQALSAGESASLTYADYISGLPSTQTGITVDPDQDGVKNGVEYLLGTDPATSDASASHPIQIQHPTTETVQLEFSYDASALSGWDLAMSDDLGVWKTLSLDLDYHITQSQTWTHPDTGKELTRITIAPLESSTATFSADTPKNFFKLLITPSLKL